MDLLSFAIDVVCKLAAADIEIARLESEKRALTERLEARTAIDRAKGILQRDLGVTEEEAYLTIQRHSRDSRRPRREIAEAIILADAACRKGA